MSKDKYPTWIKNPDNQNRWESEEGRTASGSGTYSEGSHEPDFVIVKQGKAYYLKWRTSAGWEVFPSLRAAKESVAKGAE